MDEQSHAERGQARDTGPPTGSPRARQIESDVLLRQLDHRVGMAGQQAVREGFGSMQARASECAKDASRHRRVEHRHEGVQRPMHGQREAPFPRVVLQAIPVNRASLTGHNQIRVSHPSCVQLTAGLQAGHADMEQEGGRIWRRAGLAEQVEALCALPQLLFQLGRRPVLDQVLMQIEFCPVLAVMFERIEKRNAGADSFGRLGRSTPLPRECSTRAPGRPVGP